MNCGKCIWFQTYSTLDKNKADVLTKLSCNRKNKYLNEIPETEKNSCSYFKTINDINQGWKIYGSIITKGI